jgi:hypothetical protein
MNSFRTTEQPANFNDVIVLLIFLLRFRLYLETLVVYIHNTTGRATQYHGIHERVGGTTHRILEPQNGSTAVSTNNFKHLMMTSVGRNVWCNVQKLLNKV